MGDERSRSLVLRDTNQYQRGNVQIYQWHAIYARHISKYGLVLSKLNQMCLGKHLPSYLL